MAVLFLLLSSFGVADGCVCGIQLVSACRQLGPCSSQAPIPTALCGTGTVIMVVVPQHDCYSDRHILARRGKQPEHGCVWQHTQGCRPGYVHRTKTGFTQQHL